MNEKELRSYVRSVLTEDMGPGPQADSTVSLLQRVDDGPYHMLPVDELEGDELNAAETLVMRGLLRRLPASARFPERFVVTAGGSHKTGTFAMDTFHDEKPEIRRARRNGTLKGTKW